MSLRIKNWSKFQHFKDRKPPWIKLYRDILDDLDWHDLDPLAAKCLVMIWVIASEDDGRIPDIRKLAFRLRVPENQMKSIVSKLSHWLEQDDINMISERYQDDLPETETETETELEKEKEKEIEIEAKQSSRGTRLPENWNPRPEDGLNEIELEKFRDYWRSVAGQKGVKRDWDATWRNWLRNSKQWVGGSNGKATAPETFRIGHPKGVVKFEPDRPPLSDEQKREREEFVKKTLQNFGR